MATNLRLSDELAEELRAEAERTGRSQQEVIRRALEAAFAAGSAPAGSWRAGARPPRRPYSAPPRRFPLSDGLGSLDLLERDDRL
jgi:hypothetical protein